MSVPLPLLPILIVVLVSQTACLVRIANTSQGIGLISGMITWVGLAGMTSMLLHTLLHA